MVRVTSPLAEDLATHHHAANLVGSLVYLGNLFVVRRCLAGFVFMQVKHCFIFYNAYGDSGFLDGLRDFCGIFAGSQGATQPQKPIKNSPATDNKCPQRGYTKSKGSTGALNRGMGKSSGINKD